jgi:DNA-binding MarR family transcriptional regulator
VPVDSAATAWVLVTGVLPLGQHTVIQARHCQSGEFKKMAQQRADRGRIHGGGRPPDQAHELRVLFDECVLLYLRLTALAAQIHRKGPLSGPRRTVLVSLAESGPQTVAQMARRRAQSRQRFQPLVNALMADGLLEAVPNAAHKQSPLIVLTPRGRKTVERIHKIEQAGRAALKINATPAKIAESVAVLREVRQALEGVLADPAASRGRSGASARR